jgi:NAD(P)H-hydrate repair Nnr-like enzyme with NAD(P)H-hydrate dehydratase domain
VKATLKASKRMHLVRLGGGLVGAAMLAVAVPATSGAGPFGSAAPRPAEAASSCNDNKAVTKQSGGQKATAKIPANRGSTNCLLGPATGRAACGPCSWR